MLHQGFGGYGRRPSAAGLSRWKQQRPGLAKFINSSIDTYARRLDLPAQRNFAVGQIFGVPLFNYYTFSTRAEEAAIVKGFPNNRMAWLDQVYATPESFATMCN